jgi:protein-arginine kinase activator protein McsA
MATITTIALELVVETCINCDVVYAVDKDYQARRRKDHRLFYCPNGHGQHYTAENKEDRLAREKRVLESQLQQEREARDREVGELRSQIQRQAQRVNNGVCPHCHRTFSQLARHMKAKHADVCAAGAHRSP